MKKTLIVVLSVLLVAALFVGCSNVTAESPAAESSVQATAAAEAAVESSAAEGGDTIKIAYICKMLTNPWFVLENEGLESKAAELGVEYFAIDADLDDEACDAAIDTALAQDIDGLAICITNQGNGPAVAIKCREAGVALITIDDNIVDENDQPVPHVGMPTVETGYIGGKKLAEYANERDFFADGNKVGVLQIDAPDISVLKPRLDGYKQALLELTTLTEENFFVAETTECMLEDSMEVARATIQGHPEITHWIVTGVNDDTAVAGVKTFEEVGIDKDHYLACGLGAYDMSIEQWEAGNDSYMAIVLNPFGEGEAAVQILYDYIVNGTEMPAETLVTGEVATIENWQELVK